ncbi:MAG TPA: hypothetical protein PKD85_15260, partial [Saprospiraceae bacterium]|nr:hypothetical protein [Saprospiraceae bacterium]
CSNACAFKEAKSKLCKHPNCNKYVNIDPRAQLTHCSLHTEGNLETALGYLMATRITRGNEISLYMKNEDELVQNLKREQSLNEDLKLDLNQEIHRANRLEAIIVRLESKNKNLRDVNKSLEVANKKLRENNEKLVEENKKLKETLKKRHRPEPAIEAPPRVNYPYASYSNFNKPPPPDFLELEAFLKRVGGSA